MVLADSDLIDKLGVGALPSIPSGQILSALLAALCAFLPQIESVAVRLTQGARPNEGRMGDVINCTAA